jgi:hypothetical protein
MSENTGALKPATPLSPVTIVGPKVQLVLQVMEVKVSIPERENSVADFSRWLQTMGFAGLRYKTGYPNYFVARPFDGETVFLFCQAPDGVGETRMIRVDSGGKLLEIESGRIVDLSQKVPPGTVVVIFEGKHISNWSLTCVPK